MALHGERGVCPTPGLFALPLRSEQKNVNDRGFSGVVLVRLIRKLADRVDGVDLWRAKPGDVLDLPAHEAEALIREGCATAANDSTRQRGTKNQPARAPEIGGSSLNSPRLHWVSRAARRSEESC
jgi:hypothetical protein